MNKFVVHIAQNKEKSKEKEEWRREGRKGK